MSKTREVMGLCAIVGGALGIGLVGSLVNRRTVKPWYRDLKKPPLTPNNNDAFTPISALLYGAMAITGWMIWKSSDRRKTRALAWFGGQLALNLAWAPLFFGARKPAAALVNLCLLNGLITQTMWRFRSIDRKTTFVMAPYQALVAFATYVNAGIVLLNIGRRRQPDFVLSRGNTTDSREPVLSGR